MPKKGKKKKAWLDNDLFLEATDTPPVTKKDKRKQKIKNRSMVQQVEPGHDPATGKKLEDTQGRPPEKQGGRPATSMTPKQIRARGRRKGYLTTEETEVLYQKPIAEWDMEELARGRPKDKNGKFTGPDPTWITKDLHEEMGKRFGQVIRTEMNQSTVIALVAMNDILENKDVDARGKPVVPPSVKASIAQYLLDHVVGKPKQRVEADINVKLQGLLASIMVQPVGDSGFDSPPATGNSDQLGEIIEGSLSTLRGGHAGIGQGGSAGSDIGIAGMPGFIPASVSAPVQMGNEEDGGSRD